MTFAVCANTPPSLDLVEHLKATHPQTSRADGALNIPAQPQSDSLSPTGWGAESVPRKNAGWPDTAASRKARR